MMVYDR
jgi:hypothetical protein